MNSLTNHIHDLRKTVIFSLLSLIIGFCLAIPIAPSFISFLKQPALNTLQKERIITEKVTNNKLIPITVSLPEDAFLITLDQVTIQKNQSYTLNPKSSLTYKKQEALPHFVLLGPLQGFSVLMKCALFLGAFIAAPFWLLALWRFISPGLRTLEKKIMIPFFLSMLIFFTIGALCGYFFILPPSLDYLEAFSQEIGMNMWSLPNYLEFCLFILFASGIAFELFLFLLLLIHFNVLSYEKLSSSRRAVILSCFILAALLTPPDVASQIFLAIPLWMFFEISVLYAYFKS